MVIKKEFNVYFKVDEIEAMKKTFSVLDAAHEELEGINNSIVDAMNDAASCLMDILRVMTENGVVTIKDFQSVNKTFT